MWKILLIFTIWQIWTTDVICADSYELPLWPLSKKIEPRDQTEDEFYRGAYSYFIPSSTLTKDVKDDAEEFQLQPLQSKRGFTLLARWRPFNNIGKNRASIREHNTKMKTLLDQDVVMQTRAHSRPAGQPLRWGK